MQFAAFLFLLLYPATAFARIVISEVMWMGSDLSTADEWVEITAMEDGIEGPASLSGWTLTSVNTAGQEVPLYRFGASDSLEEGAYAVVSNFGAGESRLLADPRFVTSGLSLPNTRILLRLRDGSGSVMDEVDDGVGAPFAGANPSGGIKASMERIDLSAPGAVKDNWVTAVTSQGFDDGALLLGTPGFPRHDSPVIDTDPPADATDLQSAWSDSGSTLLLTWMRSTALDLASQTLTFLPMLSDGRPLVTLGLEESVTITAVPAGSGYLVTLRSLDVSGNVSTGTTIKIEPYSEPKSGTGSSSSSSSSTSSSTSSVSSSSSSGSSGSSSSSLSSSQSSEPHPGTGAPVITEILADAIGSDANEWIEIGNRGTEAVDIAGWVLRSGTKSYAIAPAAASGFLLLPRSYAVFRQSVTGLVLPNAGGMVTLERGGVVVDTLSYPEAEEGVSFGRDLQDPFRIGQFCAPTEGQPNGDPPWEPGIIIQSGQLRDAGRVSLNLEAGFPQGFRGAPRCLFDFGDGSFAQTCNPGTHVFDRIGRFTVRAEMSNYCGTTVIRDLTVEVYAAEEEQSGGSAGSPLALAAARSSSSAGTGSAVVSCTITASDGVTISEVFPNPEGADGDGEWIELFNGRGEEVQLCGWKLGTASSTRTFALDAVTLPPNGVVSFGREVTGLTLRNTEDAVRLLAPAEDGALAIIDEVRYTKAKDGQSYARGGDGSFAWTKQATPGEANLESTKSEQKNPETTGTKKNTTTKKAAKKTTTSTSKNTKRRSPAATSSKGKATNARNTLQDAAPLLADVESSGGGSFTFPPFSFLEIASFVGNAALLGFIGWRKSRGTL